MSKHKTFGIETRSTQSVLCSEICSQWCDKYVEVVPKVSSECVSVHM
jgi:hypothetical protein